MGDILVFVKNPETLAFPSQCDTLNKSEINIHMQIVYWYFPQFMTMKDYATIMQHRKHRESYQINSIMHQMNKTNRKQVMMNK